MCGNAQCHATLVYFLSSLRAQKKKNESAQKVGFPPIPERVPKNVQKNSTFCVKSARKMRFAALLALFLESAETPLFVHINAFAIWALRLDRKDTTLQATQKAKVVLFAEPLPLGSFEAIFRISSKIDYQS